jgi:ferredoxin
MRMIVDETLCEANSICTSIAPDVFDVGDDDISHVLVDEVGEDRREEMEQAVKLCPRTAIRIEG